jgi:hypothetical protein
MERSISPYLQTSLSHPPNLSTRLSDSPVADIFDHSSSPTNIPSAGALNTIAENIRTQLLSVARLRDEACDRMIRELALRKKERMERERIQDLEQAKRDADERRLQLKKATTPKKREREEERPLAVGAHGVARQDGRDGSGSHQGKQLIPFMDFGTIRSPSKEFPEPYLHIKLEHNPSSCRVYGASTKDSSSRAAIVTTWAAGWMEN